jgi:hypothetical protein
MYSNLIDLIEEFNNTALLQAFRFLATKSQFASFQKASTYLGRAFRQSM